MLSWGKKELPEGPHEGKKELLGLEGSFSCIHEMCWAYPGTDEQAGPEDIITLFFPSQREPQTLTLSWVG